MPGTICFLGVEGAVRLDEARGDLLTASGWGGVADGWSVAGASPRAHPRASDAATPIRDPSTGFPPRDPVSDHPPSQARMQLSDEQRAIVEPTLPFTARIKASSVTTSTMMPPCRLSGIRATIRLRSGDQPLAGLSCVRGWSPIRPSALDHEMECSGSRPWPTNYERTVGLTGRLSPVPDAPWPSSN